MRIDVQAVRILVEKPPPVDPAAPESAAGSSSDTSGAHGGGVMGGPTIGGMGRDAGGAGSTADNEEESADQVHPPVNVEVQGIIYIYNPPPAQEAGKAEGENNGPTAPAAPAPAGSVVQPLAAQQRRRRTAPVQPLAAQRRSPQTTPIQFQFPAARQRPPLLQHRQIHKPNRVEVAHESQKEIRSQGDPTVHH